MRLRSGTRQWLRPRRIFWGGKIWKMSRTAAGEVWRNSRRARHSPIRCKPRTVRRVARPRRLRPGPTAQIYGALVAKGKEAPSGMIRLRRIYRLYEGNAFFAFIGSGTNILNLNEE